MQRLPPHLIYHRFNDLGIAVPDVENAESAKAVDVLLAVDVAIGVRTCIRPLDDRGRAFGGRCFAILQETGIDVVAKRLDGFARDPSRVLRSDLRLGDQF